jgi:hypothetical protein
MELLWVKVFFWNGRTVSSLVHSVSDGSHAEGGHWTERSEGSGWSDSGMADVAT